MYLCTDSYTIKGANRKKEILAFISEQFNHQSDCSGHIIATEIAAKLHQGRIPMLGGPTLTHGALPLAPHSHSKGYIFLEISFLFNILPSSP